MEKAVQKIALLLHIEKRLVYIGGISLLYAWGSLLALLLWPHFIHGMITWNVFLAALPLLFAVLAQKLLSARRNVLAACCTVLWLLLFPNAPYLVTDLLHMNLLRFYGSSGYTTDLLAWLRLAHVGIGVLLGTLLGLLSLDMMRREVRARKGKCLASAAVAAVCLLSGYGIYIGRFLRVNSWDALNPVMLIHRLLANLTPFAIGFSLLMGAYTLAAYTLFWAFEKGRHDHQQ